MNKKLCFKFQKSLLASALCVCLANVSIVRAQSQTIEELTAEKDRIELELGIAETEKKLIAAKTPAFSASPLSGKITPGAGGFGQMGQLVAIKLAEEIAVELCSLVTKENGNVLVYDPAVVSGIVSAQALRQQINSLTVLLGDAEKKYLQEAPSARIGASLVAPIAIATGTLKALADLAALLKSDISVNATAYSAPKKLVTTAMLDTKAKCEKGKLFTTDGYRGEQKLMSEYDKVVVEVRNLLVIQNRLAVKLKVLTEEAKAAEGEEKKTKTELRDKLAGDLATVEVIFKLLKPEELGDKSPLFQMVSYSELAKNVKEGVMLDISDITLDGVTIIKDNLFTGQKLRLSATIIAPYRLHKIDGTFVSAGILRKVARPQQIDLRGDDVAPDFFNLIK